ncbi:Rap1a/Tai family immunity protein [Roseomonas haemaphysalidis]|uniref:Rap1a immunity protein domain-containing protein n=1 Tax=Roseomonas haemaphysalidis TaxID=2768162 RepID=A0ABS3KNH6_9PROT|nr:Rap1a/Tai family immunity protein [Roseomonas haemaphysalidis]MBO1078153.1 hypothetical protein [Roseomonas haemaphysalidis]
MRNIAAAAALVLMSGAPVLAQAPMATAPATPVTEVRTAADLAAVCDPAASNPLRLESIAYCQGFLTGAGQYYAALHPASATTPPLFCLPQTPPSVAQTGLAFAAWSRQNPQHGAEPAVDGLLRWAQATYPCPAAAAPATTRRPAR